MNATATMDQRPCVLAVDDNATNLRILEELLRDDYDVVCAEDGVEALGTASETHPNLVLLDVMMPKLDGFEVCRRLRSTPEHRDTRILMLSVRGQKEDRLMGYELGADDYVTKPFDEDEVLAKVRALIRLGPAARIEELGHVIDDIQEITCFSLVALTNCRDTETGQHLLQIRAYSQLLALELSQSGPYTSLVTGTFLDQLMRSSPLHDIGKVAVPDAILLKRGPLTEGEFRIMKQHTTIGAELLRSAMKMSAHGSFLEMAADVARSHHERWDGQGYPDGLSGEGIPLAARIVAVADVYDALTSTRNYKAAYPRRIAAKTIQREAGTQFDPAVVAAFTAREPQFYRISQTTRDT